MLLGELEFAVNNLTSAEAAFNLVTRSIPILSPHKNYNNVNNNDESNGNDNIDDGVILNQDNQIQQRRLVCGPKGLCLLLSYIQRNLRLQSSITSSSSIPYPWNNKNIKAQDKNQYGYKLKIIQNECNNESISSSSSSQIIKYVTLSECRDLLWNQVETLSYNESKFFVNGRIFDSLIRSYCDDIEV